MSDAIFPSLPGISFEIVKTPVWKTITQESVSGIEVRASLRNYPRWKYSIPYEFLRSAVAYGELQSLVGFFNARRGAFDSFLFSDPDDCAVTLQTIGIGTGAAVAFQLLRSYGGFIDPVMDLNGAPAVYLDGVLQTSGYAVGSTGVIAFTPAPAVGVVIAATFSYYWRVRFTEDTMDFSKFSGDQWAAKKVEFITVRS
jgi:uncharacterized protein (TIGR02217 family)